MNEKQIHETMERTSNHIGLALGGRVARVFDFMGIAEEELARLGVKRKGDLAALFPGEFLHYDEELYRHHARELVERMRRDQRTSLGTRAEVLLTMMKASLVSPLTRAGQAVYEHLFAELFPEHAKRLGIVPCAPVHPTQVEDDIGVARRKLDGVRAKI